MFNIILALSKNILYLKIPPIQLLMVIIVFHLSFKAAREALDHKRVTSGYYRHVCIYVRITDQLYVFSL